MQHVHSLAQTSDLLDVNILDLLQPLEYRTIVIKTRRGGIYLGLFPQHCHELPMSAFQLFLAEFLFLVQRDTREPVDILEQNWLRIGSSLSFQSGDKTVMTQYCNPKFRRKLGTSPFGLLGDEDEVESSCLFANCLRVSCNSTGVLSQITMAFFIHFPVSYSTFTCFYLLPAQPNKETPFHPCVLLLGLWLWHFHWRLLSLPF